MKSINPQSLAAAGVLGITAFAASPAMALPKTGHAAPDFQVKTAAGATYKLSASEGKRPILLNFFATW